MHSGPTRKKRSFRWMKMLAFVVVLFGLLRIGGQVKTYMDLQDQAQALQAELAVAEEAYNGKLAQIDLLNDDAYIERLARERLGMVMAGETVVMTVNPEQEAVAAAPTADQVPVE